MRYLRIISILVILTLLSTVAAAESNSSLQNKDPYRIHIITMGKGDDLFSRFGHIAIMVEDRLRGTDDVYNFGTFDFDDPDLKIKYARGFLDYWVSVTNYQTIVRVYSHLNRDVWVQTLNLSPAQAASVAKKLEINALPENRVYKYRHYLDNCCTRIRDVIDDAVDGELAKKYKAQKTDRDFRYWTRKSLEGLPLFQSIILYSLGPAIDKPLTRWDEQFLPVVLLEDLDNMTIDGQPLVARKRHIVKRQGPPVETVSKLDIVVISILAVLLIVGFGLPWFWPGRKSSVRLLGMGLVFWGLVAGLGGLMLLLYWTVTTHYDTHYNENLLVNPFTHLWLVGPGMAMLFKGRLAAGTGRVLGYYLLISLALIALDLILKIGPFIQGNYLTVALALVCNGSAYGLLRRLGVIPRIPSARSAS